jgi:hypothetical protein
VYDDLVARVQAATARAAELVREAAVLAETSEAIRNSDLSARCAWCGRYRVGEAWIGEDAMPAFPPSWNTTTHTICPECRDALHERGLSA